MSSPDRPLSKPFHQSHADLLAAVRRRLRCEPRLRHDDGHVADMMITIYRSLANAAWTHFPELRPAGCLKASDDVFALCDAWLNADPVAFRKTFMTRFRQRVINLVDHTKRRALDPLKQNAPDALSPDDSMLVIAAEAPIHLNPFERLKSERNRAELDEAIAQLQPLARLALVAHLCEEKTYAEIEKEHGLKRDTAMRHIDQGLTTLRRIFGEAASSTSSSPSSRQR